MAADGSEGSNREGEEEEVMVEGIGTGEGGTYEAVLCRSGGDAPHIREGERVEQEGEGQEGE